MKTRQQILGLLVLLLCMAISGCGSEKPPEVTATPAASPTPAPTLEDVAGWACQGKAIPGAPSFTDTPDATYSIFVANMDGSPSTWNTDLPQSLKAQGVADLSSVLCVGEQVPDAEKTWDCGSYKTMSGETIYLKVSRYLLNTRLVSASTGETIFDYQVLGKMPECPQTVDTSDSHLVDSVLYGDVIGLKDIIDQQLPYFIPKSALIPQGKSMNTLDGSWDESMQVQVSPDAKLLASVQTMDQTSIQLWDVNTRSQTVTLKGHSPKIYTINDVVFSPVGKQLASSGCFNNFSCELFLWDTQSGNHLYSLLDAENETVLVGSVVFSPDGKKLAALTSGGITVWDTASGQRIQTIPSEDKGLSLLFTPDGTGLLAQVYQDFDGNMKIWDVQSGTGKVDLGVHEPYYELAFTSDGKLLKALIFSGPENEKQIEMTVFDAQTGKVVGEMQPLPEPKGISTNISYLLDADHDVLVESHYLNMDGSIRVYDLKKGNLTLTLFTYASLGGRLSHGYYLPVTHWDGERYLLDIRWLYHLLPEER